jgi:hypothetical protein
MRLVGAIGVVVCYFCAAMVGAQTPVRTVALDGDVAPIPGMDATFYTFFPWAPLDATGRVAFAAPVEDDGAQTTIPVGAWLGDGGPLELAAYAGAPAGSVGAGATFASFQLPSVAPDGRIAMTASLTVGPGGVTSANDSVIVAWDELEPTIIAREGSPTPGVAGANFRDFLAPPTALDNGGAAFYGRMPTGVAGVTSSTDRAYWATGASGLEMIIREGDAAPGAAGSTFVNLKSPRFNSAGQTAFLADANGPPSVGFYEGLWAGERGNLHLMAAEGFQAPGLPSGVKFTNVNEPVIGNGGHVAFSAVLDYGPGALNGIRQGAWVGLPGAATQRYVGDELAPGAPSGSFDSFFEVSVNRHGAVAFNAALEVQQLGPVTHANNMGMWSEWEGQLRLVAREGSEAPGTGGGIFASFGRPVINARGQVAFEGTLVPGVGGVALGSETGIWAMDVRGELQLIVREGDPVELRPGDVRTIGQIGFESWGGNGDTDRQFDDFGRLSFFALFQVGDRGLFVSERVIVPEPGTLAGALTAALLMCLACRKNRSSG